jgi:heme exporter protein C
MRIVFWPGAVPGWTLLGVWITTLRIRLQLLAEKEHSLEPSKKKFSNA